MKKLVLCATGAMATYLVPKLADAGCAVDGVTLDDNVPSIPNVQFIKANALDISVAASLAEKHYDGIFDFMIYRTMEEVSEIVPLYLQNTEHYFFFSTYRVFADKEPPIRESSPRLLDATADPILRDSDDYCIYKAKSENFLRRSPYKNWTILRPAITYSKRRAQLITLERHTIVNYITCKKSLPLHRSALDIQGTMSWAGDVAEMEKRLLFNEKALCEDFNVTTCEHHPWREIADYYKDIFGLKWHEDSEEAYLNAWGV